MEYVNGERLDEYCAGKRCSIEARLQILRQICEAVRYAHRRAVIHLDLKASNILVTSGRLPKLPDFGIAKRLKGANEPAGATKTYLRFTPAFAAPEQVMGHLVWSAPGSKMRNTTVNLGN